MMILNIFGGILALTVLITTSTAQRPHQKSLLFVFDGTGSMNSSLQQLKSVTKDILGELAGRLDSPIYNYVLTVFNDPWVNDTIDTTDPKELLAALDKVVVFSAEDNEDWSELAITGLKQSLPFALRNSIAFVISDAGAKDYHLEAEVTQTLLNKQITVNFMLSQATGDWCYRTASEKECTVYQNLASISGGKLFNVTSDAELNNVLRHQIDPQITHTSTLSHEE